MAKTTSSSKQNGKTPTHPPDPEVVPRAARRQFSAAYKRRIVAEAEACIERGAIGVFEAGGVVQFAPDELAA